MSAILKDYMRAMGFNGKQVTKASLSIGLSSRAGIERNMGTTPVSLRDALAMSARVAGLPPWNAGISAFLDDDARAAFRLAAKELSRCAALAQKQSAGSIAESASGEPSTATAAAAE